MSVRGRCPGVVLALLAGFGSWGCEAGGEPHPAPPAPGDPLASLGESQRARFLLGRALFERRLSEDEGLGPLHNAERCSDCHDRPTTGGGSDSLPVRKATRFAAGICDLLRESGGDNIQARVTPSPAADGVRPEEVPPEATGTASLVAPPLFGLGLVEAIPDSVLERMADPEDADGDGISGRLPRLSDGPPARFGRKGEAADLAGFIETALLFELGLTTPGLPVEETRNGTPVPAGVDPAPEPEIDARGLALLTDYVRYLAAPAPETLPPGPAADTVARGRRLFEEVGCAACHVPELRTGDDVEEPLRRRTVRLFSDLLVHDLGDAGTDICGEDVLPGEHRTALLWGLRHREGHMYDGRARGVPGALSRHGGEARAARDEFADLNVGERAALLRFLSTL